MCFKFFKKQQPEPLQPALRRALLFAINNYVGSANDLSGCINDQIDVETILNIYYGDFDIRKFRDSQVTTTRFKNELESAVSVLRSGDVLLVHYSGHGTQVADRSGDEPDGYDEALYLYDGVLIDDDINGILNNIPQGGIVVLALDSCFSGTATRLKNGDKKRFIAPEKPRSKVMRQFAKKGAGDLNWIVFSGCKENQTSADAIFNNRYNGAFTYCWLKAFNIAMTYRQWLAMTEEALRIYHFEQIPTLEGKEDLLNRVVFK